MKVIGMFKDECNGKIKQEFVGLRTKLYSYKMYNEKKKRSARELNRLWLRMRLPLKITRAIYFKILQARSR